MQNIYQKIFLILMSIISVSCINSDDSNNSTSTSLEFYQELNISYGSHSDQVFDLYLPANRTEETKVMILIHGGGWTSGDKSDMNSFRDYILQNLTDIAVVNMNYRLANETTDAYPTQINDITSVVDFLQNKQSEYVISDDIGFIGTSAGAHLALLWSYAFDSNNQTDMVCSVVGPTNFTDPAYLENTNPILQEMLDLFGVDATTAFLEEVSPYHQASNTSPPTILFYGGQDPLIPTTQGTAMRDKLQELGVIHDFTLYENAGHGWTGLDLLDTTIKLHAFMEAHLN
ncbi:acetyl esterase/lipase [Oceanihabitans sediminis]|uniref:Alpha/beta hydrolase n=1 Tax=Oceanihabitans sediminis TaxID=1812012 RepID=A0A368P3A5_9FLAO|nr:alpha/beta hydrolase [Oceanihabitans sediminis]MDX1774470.1 alpha/beta hydrolase [Oceanihabitans sediminis]RBP27756.1 acetyl esterase/lipase [Oceanihabitans sediminis]RCU56544.1 alpha/beta hydrolase [Oceanihabitans sediminis]